MKADMILALVQKGQAIQTKILQDHALCSLDISVSFCSNLLGIYPRAELYSCSFFLNYNGKTDSCTLTNEDEYEDAVAWLEKAEKTINNL